MRRNVQKAMLVGALVVLILGSQVVGAQGKPEGKITRSYRAGDGAGRPAWVEAALGRALGHLKANGAAYGLRDAQAELTLRGADEDDLGLTHVRLDQVKDGVTVFGGQLIAHVDANNVRNVSGRAFNSAVSTKPAIRPEQAIEAAKQILGYNGEFAESPQAQLVILADRHGPSSAVLTYLVGLRIEDGTDATANHQYFINAADGSLAYYYNDIETSDVKGTGKSLYSGDVQITTDLQTTKSKGTTTTSYKLIDTTRGGMYTNDVNNGTDNFFRQATGTTFSDSDNTWGNNSTSDRASGGVDAHFGAAQTWDYYLNKHGRRGIDGNGFRLLSRVHYGSGYNNAFWNGTSVTYGDGDGTSTFRALLSIDVVAHEITHGLTDKTADLVYEKESGALNESFSDIFGSAVEHEVADITTKPADYFVGEDIYIPEANGFRNMADPTEDNDPAHYTSRLYPEPCTPSNTNDNCGVHSNSGISNHAFYLLVNGGTHATSKVTVTGIGRVPAEKIFYRALTVYLGPSSNFSAARTATLQSATDLYGAGGPEYNATAQAWDAVGVK